ncbi:MAG TPA: hypothetical protein VNL73_11475 [Verrucomicrobiae bacterium]|nr:hypothetical protein [Verrucomicrobiae bacterium]
MQKWTAKGPASESEIHLTGRGVLLSENSHFNQPDRRGRPSRKTQSRGEIDDLLMSWRSGGEAGKRAAQILLEKYKIRAMQAPAEPVEKE